MKTSELIDQLFLALSQAQAEIEAAPKDKINPHFKSRYADLSSIWEACRGSLGKYGLAVIQSPSITPERFLRVTTRIVHKSGQWIEGELDLKPAKDDAQGMGSAITYARRYSLSSMLGVISEEDDDGNAASMPSKPKYEYKSAPKTNNIYDKNNPLSKGWLWKRAQHFKPNVSAETLTELNRDLDGLTIEAASEIVEKTLQQKD